VGILDDEAGGGHQVRDADRARGQPGHVERLLVVDLEQPQHRVLVVGQAGEVGPGRVVEQVVLQRVDDLGQGVDAQAETRHAEVVVDDERQAAGVVEVGVRDQDVPHVFLLGQAERARHPSTVEAEHVVDQEGRHPDRLDVPAVAAEDLELHRGSVAFGSK
jgi:hypothetical protein